MEEKMGGEQESAEQLLDRYVKEMDKRLYPGFEQILSDSLSNFQNQLLELLKEERRDKQQAEMLTEQQEKLEQLTKEVEELKKEKEDQPPKRKKRFKLFR